MLQRQSTLAFDAKTVDLFTSELFTDDLDRVDLKLERSGLLIAKQNPNTRDPAGVERLIHTPTK